MRTGSPVGVRCPPVATVEQRLDRRAAYTHPQLRGKPYINRLIRPVDGGWMYDEADRPDRARHHDWLWRLADHRGIRQARFNRFYGSVYQRGWLSKTRLNNGLRFVANYILFSGAASETYICPRLPVVAMAGTGEHGRWNNRVLKTLTVDTAARYLTSGRNYLRTRNGGRPHRQIHFEMSAEEAKRWRARLIAVVKRESPLSGHKTTLKTVSRTAGQAIC